MSSDRTISPLSVVNIRTLVLVAAGVISAGCETTQPADNDFLLTSFPSADKPVDGRAFQVDEKGFELPLPNGNLLTFLTAHDQHGRLHVYGLVEHRRARTRGIASVAGLSTSSLPEIYHAFSEPRTETPEFLALDQYPDPARPRGWARDSILASEPVARQGSGYALHCPETAWEDFRQDVIDQDVVDGGLPLVFLSKENGPNTTDHWLDLCPACTTHGLPPPLTQYLLEGGVNGATAVYVVVELCHMATLDYQGAEPRVYWASRIPGQDFVLQHELKLGDEYFWLGFFAPAIHGIPWPQRDYRLWIRTFYGNDRFHIGATWQKPTGTLVPNP